MIRLRRDFVAVGLAWGLFFGGGAATEPDKFVVHEWGTFSTFSGSNGKQLQFTPDDRGLPDFVYSRHRHVKGGLADVSVSLETPVVYFYTDRDRTVSVKVNFPKGMMTDWYPQASRPPEQQIRWDDLTVLAAERPALAGGRDTVRYFAARETDAAVVRTTGNDKREAEKFLFYRGVGDFQMPFVVRALGENKFEVRNPGTHEVPAFVLVGVKDKVVSFRAFGRLSPGTGEKVELPAGTSTAEKLGDTLAGLLVGQGLYEKEARAMVKTWSKDWFGDDGIRVLYLVAEPQTDEFLPMTIDPKPDRLVRVLVGRHDVLTPEREKEIDALVRRVNGPSNADAKAADASLNKLGRFRYAATKAAEGRIRPARAGR